MTEINELLKEADGLGIINIEAGGENLTPGIIKKAIEATKRLNSQIDDNLIVKKIQEAGTLAAT